MGGGRGGGRRGEGSGRREMGGRRERGERREMKEEEHTDGSDGRAVGPLFTSIKGIGDGFHLVLNYRETGGTI